MTSLQSELEFLSDLNKHESLRVTISKELFTLDITTSCLHSFSVHIPPDYPSDLKWKSPLTPKQLDFTQGKYRASYYPIAAGVYEILLFYSSTSILCLAPELEAVKQFLDGEESSLFDSFEEIPDSGSVGSDYEFLCRPPSSIESLDTASCSDQETSDDGAESDTTVTGEDENILDSVIVLEPLVASPAALLPQVLQTFGLSAACAHQLLVSNGDQCEHRLCMELGIISESGLYNGPGDSMQLRVIEDDIKKWELKVWGFPEPCNLNSELLRYSPTDCCVTLEVTFPSEYPFVPPFIRIVSPPIQAGHVIMGGALFLDVLLPTSCKYLGSNRAYSVSISLMELFTQITYSMVDGNAKVNNDPAILETYTYEKAHFVYSSILGLLSIDWGSIISSVMRNNRESIGYNNNSNSRMNLYNRY